MPSPTTSTRQRHRQPGGGHRCPAQRPGDGRVALYDDDFAYVEAGLKGLLDGELWGYYGNTCGDADGDGHNETVQALAIDLGWGYDIVYGIGGFLLPDRTWTSMGPRYPLGWFDLLGGAGSTALQPMLLGPATVTEGQGVTYTVKMRPCYHYPDQVNFTITPGTWNGNKFIPKPKSNVASENSSMVSRSFNTAGTPTLVVTNTTKREGARRVEGAGDPLLFSLAT